GNPEGDLQVLTRALLLVIVGFPVEPRRRALDHRRHPLAPVAGEGLERPHDAQADRPIVVREAREQAGVVPGLEPGRVLQRYAPASPAGGDPYPPAGVFHLVLAMPSTIWTVLSRTKATILRPGSAAVVDPPGPPESRRSPPARTARAPCHLGSGLFALRIRRTMRTVSRVGAEASISSASPTTSTISRAPPRASAPPGSVSS